MRQFIYSKWILAIVVCFVSLSLAAQNGNAAFNSYIKRYSQMAIDQMNRYKIPASITLSQGLLESGAGNSLLARTSNNHFGIKCGRAWNGPSVRHTDDAPNECFRAYGNVADSYEDHSLFLKNNQRYAFLFKLDKTDYRGWAKGLKSAGYATDPSYANRLISIIEDYRLYQYDNLGVTKREEKRWAKLLKRKPWLANPHQVYKANGLAYVIARNGDSFNLIGKEFAISWKKLTRYNDLGRDYTLQSGDIVYLTKKHKAAVTQSLYYIVKSGDSMHSISQKYGIRLKNLYRLNGKSGDYVPEVGDRIWLQ